MTKIADQQATITVSPIQMADAATHFMTGLENAKGATVLATLMGAVVFIVGWHLKDKEQSLPVSKIKEALVTDVEKNMGKLSRGWAMGIVNASQRLASKLCYKGDKAVFGGVIHNIAECHNPATALECLQAWAVEEELTTYDALQTYLGYKSSNRKKGSKGAKARQQAKAEGKLVTNLVDDLASLAVAIEKTEDSKAKAELQDRASMSIAHNNAIDPMLTVKYICEDKRVKLETLETIVKMVSKIYDARLEQETKPSEGANENTSKKRSRSVAQAAA